MTQAVAVRRDGDTFQARMFWLRAACLLDPASRIAKVAFETGPRSFDDILIEYEGARALRDQYGAPLLREHVQCKWHVAPDQYGYAQLVDPDFINATARSHLQRADDAHRGHAAMGTGSRYTLLTNWRIHRADPLRTIIGTRSNGLRLEKLFDGSTDASRVGKIRKTWREHLGIDDTALRALAGSLAFAEATDSLDDLRERLDVLFGLVGLRRVPAHQSAFSYDDLVFQWMAQGRSTFDRSSFREACAGEGLLAGERRERTVHGVKSFEHPIDRLEDRCADVLDLVPAFDERYIRSDADWAERLYPELRSFLLRAAREGDRIKLALDAHATLAFAAGSVLDVKCGRVVELEQRTGARSVWAPDDGKAGDATLVLNRHEVAGAAPDLAVAVGLTHDIDAHVFGYVAREVPTVGRILGVALSAGRGARVVAGGRHACDVADAVTAAIRSENAARHATVHLFIAAPNAFTFMLGQRHKALGRSTLYEFDFDGARGGSYRASLSLPVSAASTTGLPGLGGP